MPRKIKHPLIISDDQLFQQKKNIFLIACSGGMDSCALVHLFHQRKLNFAIAHVNYHLRGNDSIKDEAFVQSLGKKYKLKVYTYNASAELKKLQQEYSLQEAARIIRYTWLNEIMLQHGFNYLVTAHHANDQAETLLLNLFRGTGMRGMGGMKVKNKFHIRPLLHVTRKEIETYAKKNKIKFRTDKSNLSDSYDRNYIRLHVLPLIEKRWPQVVPRLSKNAENLQHDIELSDELLATAFKKILAVKKNHTEIRFKKILQQASPKTWVFALLHPYGFNIDQCGAIIESAASSETKTFHSPMHTLYVKNMLGWLEKNKKNESATNEITITKKTTHIKKPVDLRFSYHSKKITFSKNSSEAYIDADKISFPLTLRTWKPGDIFIPIGMRGKKKISDLLTDLKLTPAHKKNVHVLCDANHIIWVVGIRPDDRVKITTTTKHSLVVSLKDRAK